MDDRDGIEGGGRPLAVAVLFSRDRGGANREGKKVFGRAALVGDVGVGTCEGPATLEPRAAGEAGRASWDGAGDDERICEGEPGRARRDGGASAGLAERGMPPVRRDTGPGAGDPDRGMPVTTRDA